MSTYHVLLARFPFTDASRTKLRPVLVLADIPGENCIVCKISTKHRPNNPYEIPIQGHKDHAINASYAHIDTVFTLHNSLVEKPLGTITNKAFAKTIQETLRNIFSL